jgi:hypothetical protein
MSSRRASGWRAKACPQSHRATSQVQSRRPLIVRFGIGFVIGAARLPWPGWAVGLFFGLLLTIPDALITKACAPIMGTGALGGTTIEVVIARFGR